MRYNEKKKRSVMDMIQVIYGKKGSGKTKKILDLANTLAAQVKGNTVFIDDDQRYMYDLKYQVRFVNAGEYNIEDPKMFLGFLIGMMAKDFDLELLFVDGFLRIVNAQLKDLADFFAQLSKASEQHNVRVIMSVSGSEEDRPAFLDEYLLKD
jgi:Ni2+-binding GTPase involved in maturation of urease and hydrogenase